MKKQKLRALIGAGGHSHDVFGLMWPVPRFVEDKYWQPNYETIYPLSQFDPDLWEVFIAIANPEVRARISEILPPETEYFSFIHHTATVMPNARLGRGSLVGAGAVVVSGAEIGDFAILNMLCCIGHDAKIGRFFTIAPQAGVMGDCILGDRVEIGAGAQIRQKTWICNDVTIGMQAAVVKDITDPGTYVGVPAKKMETKK